MNLLGVDTGGTFTDFVLLNDRGLQTCKVLSTPDAPERAILNGMKLLNLTGNGTSIVHGSTVATNAVLERKGVRTLFVTNHGLGDMLDIGRQARPELYQLQPVSRNPLLALDERIEVGGRISSEGDICSDLTLDDIDRVRDKIEQLAADSIAINFIFSWKNQVSEHMLADALPEDLFVTCSSDVLPRSGEYERGVATWLNAYVGPLVQGYLNRLQAGVSDAALSVMQSNGGTCDIDFAGRQAVNLLLSGPAGGLQAARYIGELVNSNRLLTFDMGGTSTDVAMIDGRIILTDESHIGDLPVAVPMVDMHTIGAGGGSLAWLDEAGVLQVGPESAGATPGPACYSNGGMQATVTDANVVLGRMPASTRLGGSLQLDYQAAVDSVARLADQLQASVEDVARGIVALANEHMAAALRVISVQRGVDPRDFVLASFGGAGGLHVCALAEAMGMKRAIAPVNAGVLSALGMLVAPASRELVQAIGADLGTLSLPMLSRAFEGLLAAGREALLLEGVASEELQADYSVDLQYRGQSFVLNLPWGNFETLVTEFHRAHEARYGYALNEPVELINLRLSLSGPAPDIRLPEIGSASFAKPVCQKGIVGVEGEVPVWMRTELVPGQIISGPAIISEAVSTTWIASNWECRTDEWCNLLLEKC